MSAVGLAAGVAGVAFFLTSILHAVFNDVHAKGGPAHPRLLRVHYAVLVVFAAAGAVFAWSWRARVAGALEFVVPFWLAIHLGRLVLDWSDGRGSRNGSTLLRHAADATASLSTVVFVLAAATSGGAVLTALGLALALGMVGKELLFRVATDLVKRPRSKRKTSQQGDGRASPRHFVSLHLLANSLKSTAYMLLGFSLAYRRSPRYGRPMPSRSSTARSTWTSSRGLWDSP